MRKLEHTTKRFLASCLLILFIGYVSSVTLFFHAHLINGQLVAHSHPYANAPDTGKHTHNTTDWVTISFLTILLMLSPSFTGIIGPFIPNRFEKIIPVVHYLKNRKTPNLTLRAPPAC